MHNAVLYTYIFEMIIKVLFKCLCTIISLKQLTNPKQHLILKV